ncbi:MAG: hypothetical protein FJ224_03080 [Lentisphaerae bacterium]|nr:hypothetical protein [Lentisphaerota bacterium]
MTVAHVFAVLLIAGLFLIGAEIFVPGGILGVFGGVSLLAAIVVGFKAFPGYGVPVAVGITLLVALAIALWMRVFPHTALGKKLTVARDMSDAKAADPDLAGLVGQHGATITALRPGGFAEIDGRRMDVVTEGAMVESGKQVRVVAVHGNRIVVAPVS